MKPTVRTRMFGRGVSMLLVAVAILAASAAPAAASTVRYVVGFKPGTGASERSAGLRSVLPGLSSRAIARGDVPAVAATAITVDAASAATTRAALLRRSDVAWVEVDHVAHAFWNPGDPDLFQQWGLQAVHATQAWDTSRGAGITIAVVDTGVNYNHEDLAGKVDKGYDYVDNDADPKDVNGHGTHVSGIAAGIAGNGRGGAGLAPSARILAVRVLDGDGSGYYSWIANGITYAADHGAKVINLSLGGPDGSNLLREAIGYAAARGVVVACASGNDGVGKVSYPAAYGDCLSVGATDDLDLRADFSNYGAGLDVVAPGEGIYSSVKDGGYESWDGTSMATPFVSGLAALLKAQGLSRQQVVSVIESSAKDIGARGYDIQTGHGRIDAAAAVAAGAALADGHTDTAAPVVNTFQVGALYTTSTAHSSKVWKKVRSTRWRTVGVTAYGGDYAWTEKHISASKKRIAYFRMHAGLVKQRSVTLKKVTKTTRSHQGFRNLTVTATDDVAVDRVGLKIDGHWYGTDWSAAGGWSLPWGCVAGNHTFAVYAWDARDNQVTRTWSGRVTC